MLLRRLDRYVFSQVLGPLALGLGVFTFILLMDVLFDAAEIIIRRDVSVWLVGELLLLNLPHIVVLTIPMAFLYGLLIAIGRLSADSELIAIRASGISLFSLYRPILVLSALLALATLLAMLYLLPWGNTRREDLLREIRAAGIATAVKPRVFYEELEDKILYVFDTTPGDSRWQGVFLADALPESENTITVAQFGELRTPEEGPPTLVLQNSLDQEVDLLEPEDIQSSLNRLVEIRLEGEEDGQEGQRSKGLREMFLHELQQVRADPEASDSRRRLALVEIHKRFSIPAACLVFGLFGLPLGFSNQRGGRSSGFALSTAVILVFYVLLNNGEELAAQGRLAPWMAMWGPNLLFTVLGAFLLARKNRDKSLLLTRVDRWVRSHLWARLRARQRLRQRRRYRRRAAAQAARETRRELRLASSRRPTKDFVVRLPRPRLRFPNLFDRYVIRLFARVFVMVVLAVLAVYIIADFTGLVADIMENQIPGSVVFDYYQYKALQIIYQLAPVVVLLTTLTTFAILSYSNEITAVKALGMSLYRLAVPALATATLVAGLSIFLDVQVLPYTNTRVAELHDRIKGREQVRSYRRADQQWLFGRDDDGDGYIYNYQYYDDRRQSLQRLQIFRFDEQHRLTGRLYASNAIYRDDAWWVTGGWAREFDGVQVERYVDLAGPTKVDLPETPEFFDSEIRRPEQMGPRELRNYIRDLRAAGEEVPELEVQLHSKLAMPLVCLVMALVALPFAFRLGRRGALYGIGISLALGMAFYGVIAFFITLGETAALPPAVAVWSPNVLFATVSLYLFLGVRT